ncbi:MAG: type II secretion system F family protein [Deltaproteobacteria bacterium]|nr:type II secretion system F family protein [Deltaproteobacteria bacterium]
MPIFYYRATDAAGKIITGNLESRDERAVVQHLHEGGLIPLSISLEEPEARSWKALLPGRRRISRTELIHFTNELAVLLQAGLPLDRSLKILRDITKRPGLKAALDQVYRDIQAGKSLSEALARHRAFSPFYLSLVEAGEAGGFLEIALQRLGDYLKAVGEFRHHLLTSLIYPMVLAGVGGLSIILMLLLVVPRFELFFKEMGQSLFWSTRMLLGLSTLLRRFWWVGLLLTALAVLVVYRYFQTSHGRLALDRWRLKAPLFGELTRNVAASFFAKTLGTLLKSGVPLVGALEVVVASVGNRYLARSLDTVVEDVKKGQSLSGRLRKSAMFPDLFLEMIAVGEETGQLADMLIKASDSLESEARIKVRRLLAILEPALILIMALVVAFVIVSLLLPILNLYEIQF